MVPRYSRRRLLGATAGATVVAAGCLDSSGRAANGSDCGDRWERSFGDELAYGSNGGFSLTVSPGTVSFGDETRFELRNESGEGKRTGSEELYTIQKGGDGEWTNVFAEPAGFDGKAKDHAPGEGFEWSLEFTRSSVEGSWLTTCGELETGSYRFVYFGLPAADTSSNPAVATKFTVDDG